jgi:hypothetical protein
LVPESDDCDIRSRSCGDSTDVLNVDLARDHFVAERDDDRCDVTTTTRSGRRTLSCARATALG